MTNNLDYVDEVENYAKQKEIEVLKNGGSPLFDCKACLIYLPLNVNVNENSLTTILYVKDMRNIPGVIVTMDTMIQKDMKKITRDGMVFKFKEFGSGLYCYDMASTYV